MSTLGQRLYSARKQRGHTQQSLAEAIGVSRGVIFNLEKDKTTPQPIVANAVCGALGVRRDWLLTGTGPMEEPGPEEDNALLAELYEAARELTEDEQLYLLDAARALKRRLGKASYVP